MAEKRSAIVADLIKRIRAEAAKEENQNEATQNANRIIIEYLTKKQAEYKKSGD